jgi:hypothetical protein
MFEEVPKSLSMNWLLKKKLEKEVMEKYFLENGMMLLLLSNSVDTIHPLMISFLKSK